MGDQASGAILYAILDIYEIAATLISERKEGTTTKHAVEHLARRFVARKVFTFYVFKISPLLSYCAVFAKVVFISTASQLVSLPPVSFPSNHSPSTSSLASPSHSPVAVHLSVFFI